MFKVIRKRRDVKVRVRDGLTRRTKDERQSFGDREVLCIPYRRRKPESTGQVTVGIPSGDSTGQFLRPVPRGSTVSSTKQGTTSCIKWEPNVNRQRD